MNYALHFHPLVESDVRRIFASLADYAGLASAERKAGAVIAALEGLRNVPHKGSLRHEIARGLRAIPVGKTATIIFTVHDEIGVVEVHMVAFGGEDWIRRVRSRL